METKDFSRQWASVKECRFTCNSCGWTITIPKYRDGRVCKNCSSTVLTEKGKFKIRMKKEMEKINGKRRNN